MYDDYLDEFMPSKDMRDYLKNVSLSILDVARIIYGSPLPVHEKFVALTEYYEKCVDKTSKYLSDEIMRMIYCIVRSQNIRYKDGIFTLEIYSYNEITNYSDSVFISLYTNYMKSVYLE